MEAVLLVEIDISSLWVLMETKLEEAEWVQMQLGQVNIIKVKRLTTLCSGRNVETKPLD